MTEVRLRHYARIKRSPGTSPVTIQRKFIKCSGGSYGPDIASQFVNLVSSLDNTLVIQGTFEYGYEYKITPTADLKSFQVAGEPPVVWDQDYIISLYPPVCSASSTPYCESDTNGDDSINVTDLLKLLASWGACTDCVADINCDGTVNVTDLLDLLAAWGPCNVCPSEGQSSPNPNTTQFNSLLAYNSQYGPVSDTWSTSGDGLRLAADEFKPVASTSVTQIHWWGFYEQSGADCAGGYNESFTITYYNAVTHPSTGQLVPAVSSPAIPTSAFSSGWRRVKPSAMASRCISTR